MKFGVLIVSKPSIIVIHAHKSYIGHHRSCVLFVNMMVQVRDVIVVGV